jgi:hypothetical protein
MIKTMNILLINVYYEVEILNIQTSVNCTIDAAYTIYVSDTISFEDLMKQVHTDLDLLPNQQAFEP